jgi:hypothetical protein
MSRVPDICTVLLLQRRGWLEQIPSQVKQGRFPSLVALLKSVPGRISLFQGTPCRQIGLQTLAGKRGGRGEQGRPVSATRTTMPRDGGRVQRPRSAGFPILHGAGLAAVGG